MLRDIIEFKQNLNDLTKDNKDLERLRQDFLLMISHQLKTPLTSIYVGSQCAIKAYNALPEEQRELLPENFFEFLEIIFGGAKKIKDVIDDFISENYPK